MNSSSALIDRWINCFSLYSAVIEKRYSEYDSENCTNTSGPTMLTTENKQYMYATILPFFNPDKREWIFFVVEKLKLNTESFLSWIENNTALSMNTKSLADPF